MAHPFRTTVKRIIIGLQSLLLHDFGAFISHSLPFLKVMESPVMIILQVPHLGSSHFETDGSGGLLVENSALV